LPFLADTTESDHESYFDSLDIASDAETEDDSQDTVLDSPDTNEQDDWRLVVAYWVAVTDSAYLLN